MRTKPPECHNCPLEHIGEGFVEPYGSGANGIWLLGMAPETAELHANEPFVGRSGTVLSKIMKTGGLQKADFVISNTIQCRPPNPQMTGYETEQAIKFCKVHRDAVIARFKPEHIVALGNIPLKTLTGMTGIEQKRGYRYRSTEYDLPVVGTYHPAYMGRGKMNLIQASLYDLKVAYKKPSALPSNIDPLPTPDTFKHHIELAILAPEVAIDTETDYDPHQVKSRDAGERPAKLKPLIRASFAYGFNGCIHAVSFPWTMPYTADFKRLAAAPNAKIFWNADFDILHLEHEGYPVTGTIIDAMWYWHFLFPDLPRGLAHVATYYTNLPEWKSLYHVDFPLYSACDSHATLENWLGIRKHLQTEKLWDAAEEHVGVFLTLLSKISKRGMNVDHQKLQEFKTLLSTELAQLAEKINEAVPAEIKRVKTYKKKPPKTLPFLPNSSPQVQSYLRYKKYKVAKRRRDTGVDSDTTEAKFLQQLATQHRDPILYDILHYRRLKKLLGTYAEWPIGSDGRIHTQFTLAPATGRLSSRNPNIQNIPRSGPLAMAFRKTLVASPGCTMLRRDYQAIEAVLVGYFANDPNYIALAKKGIHAYAVATYLNRPVDLNTDGVRDYLAAFKTLYPDLYDKMKRSIHGINYGMGYLKLFNENPGVYANLHEARAFHTFCSNISPNVTTWQEHVTGLARQQRYLQNPYDYRRWFFDIPGEDTTKSIAFLPQSTAAAIIKEAMLILDDTPAGQYLVWQIHDELVLDVPTSEVESVDKILKMVMERKLPKLGDLVITTTRRTGATFAD